jgi:oxygen-independent coproporphyrinogen-3 oxidase
MSREKITKSSIGIDVTKNVNLLKKYHKSLVFDYTEYPTKSNWPETFDEVDYSESLINWLRDNPKAESLFYVHTPFCEELCYFCLCSKEITKDYEKVKNYLYNYLFKEIDLLKDVFKEAGVKPNFKEIYFGGGSPTFYREEEFAALRDKISDFISFSDIESWTVEIDPRRVGVDRLRFYHKMGVNRLSFGIQDFDPPVQEEINRIQPPELVSSLLTDEVRSLFPAINFDLLIGLPAQTLGGLTNTIEEVIKLRPTQLQTMYVHYKPDVRKYMTRMVRNGPMPDFYDRKALFNAASKQLIDSGYSRAGFESYALPGDELAQSIEEKKAYYNSLGTQRGAAKNFIAVGSSAHGVFGNTYVQNFYEQNLYKEALDQNKLPIYRGRKLNEEDMLRRTVINQIRTYFRIFYTDFNNFLGCEKFKEHFAEEIEMLKEFEKDKLVVLGDDGFELTELGTHFSPQVCEVFDKYANRKPYNLDIPVVVEV